MPRDRGSLGFTKGMASPDPAHNNRKRRPSTSTSIAFPPSLLDGMKRWTNGLPGATTRLGASLAFEAFPLVSLDARGYP